MPRTLVAAVAVLAVMLTACGGGSKKSSPTTTPAATLPATVVVTPTASTSVTGCTPAEAQQAIDAYKNAQPTLEQFDDARGRANEATLDALSSIITEMQDISRNATAIPVPACAQPSRDHLVSSINGVAQALTDAQAGKPETDVQASANEARSRYDLFTQDLANLLHDAALK